MGVRCRVAREKGLLACGQAECDRIQTRAQDRVGSIPVIP